MTAKVVAAVLRFLSADIYLIQHRRYTTIIWGRRHIEGRLIPAEYGGRR